MLIYYKRTFCTNSFLKSVFFMFVLGSGSLNAQSPDFGFASSPIGVRDAANNLVVAIQNTSAPSPPEPHVIKILLHWLQQVSNLFCKY